MGLKHKVLNTLLLNLTCSTILLTKTYPENFKPIVPLVTLKCPYNQIPLWKPYDLLKIRCQDVFRQFKYTLKFALLICEIRQVLTNAEVRVIHQ